MRGSPCQSPSAHAHDFMSYGSTSGVHTYSWVSPVTYKNVRDSVLATLPPTALAPAPAPATEKLVVGGTMDASGQVSLAPSRIVKTDYTKGSGQSGGLKITLVSGSGETLGTYRFDAQPVIPGYGYVFNEFVPWVPGTRSIVLSRGNTVLVRRAVSAAQPTVTRVRAQAAGAHRLRVDWAASDADGDPLSYSIYFNSGLDEKWIPVAFELTGQSATIDTTLLPASKRARVRVRASDGVNSGEAEGPVRLGRNLPIPAILSPTSGRTASAEVRLEGAVYDPQTGLLSGDRLHWRSDRDGDLGRGKIIHRRLSSGRHVITLTAANDAGASVTTGKEVTVP